MWVLLWSLVAVGQVALGPAERERPDTPEGLIADLIDGRDADQLYAARELRRLTSVALRDHNGRDPIRSMEARQFLVIFDDRLAPACITLLTSRHLQRPCVDILGMLQAEAALTPLLALKSEASWPRRRRIDRAIGRLKEE
jgi:hypothetical protein